MKFNLPKRLWTGITLLLPLIAITMLAGCNAATANSATPTPNFSIPPPSNLATPEMIEWDYEHGNITEEQRVIYLVYMLYDHDSLPARYYSNVWWEGTTLVAELLWTVESSETVCRFSTFTQNELRRVLGDTVASCKNENNNILIVLFFVLCGLVIFVFVYKKKMLSFIKSL